MNDIISIYGTDGCTYCRQAFMLARITDGYQALYIDIGKDRDSMKELTDKIGTFKTVPQIFINEQHIGGFEELKEILEGS